jgi:hypothetical protein
LTNVPSPFFEAYMPVMATIQDHGQLELPIAQKIACRRCSGAGEVYYARTGAEVVGGKRIECPECDGRGEIDLTAQLFGLDLVLRSRKRR